MANKLLPAKAVSAKYGVTVRTVDRWVRDPNLNFPKPISINGRNYFEDDKLEAFDQATAAKSRVAS
jgi:predicted DNA-binding transcriptional regulator AlpA